MKKEYQSPELDIEILESNDVILLSDLTGGGGGGYKNPFDPESLPRREDIFRI